MSKLDDLIRELCPDGVEYKTIKDLFNTRNGYTPSKNNNEYWQDGTIPWFRMEDIREHGSILSDSIQHVNKKAVKGDLFPENAIIVATSATIGEHALITVPSISNQRFTYLMAKDEWAHLLDMKFVYYYCYKLDEWCLSHLNQGNFASVDMKQFAKFRFPVPPLEVQREIVRILDHFTLLTAELTDELALRKEQFEEILHRLINGNSDKTQYKLSEICHIEKGKTAIQKAESGEFPLVVTTTERKTCSNYQFDGEAVCIPLVSSRGHGVASLNHVYYQSGKFALGNILCAVLPNDKNMMNVKYLYYYFECTKDYLLVPLMKGGANVSMHIPDIERVNVSLPSIAEQNKRVYILENLQEYYLNLLPAEITSRKKQYEYYRDKLLTFKARA